MYGFSSCYLSRYLFVCAALQFSVPSQVNAAPAAPKIRIFNGGTTSAEFKNVVIRLNGSTIIGVTGGIAPGTWTPSEDTGSPDGTLTVRVDGQNCYNISGNTSGYTDTGMHDPAIVLDFGYLVTPEGPPLEWRYKVTINNKTSVSQKYNVYYNASTDPGTLQATIWISPGANYTFTVGPKTAKGYVVVASEPAAGAQYIGDGMYADLPAGEFTFAATPSSSGWYSSGGGTADEGTHFGKGLLNSTNNIPLDFSNNLNTNTATEGTLQTGFNGLAGMQQGYLNQLLAQARMNNQAIKDLETSGSANASEANQSLGNIEQHNAQMNASLGGIQTNLSARLEAIRTNSTSAAGNTNVAQRVHDGGATDGSSTVGDHAGQQYGAEQTGLVEQDKWDSYSDSVHNPSDAEGSGTFVISEDVPNMVASYRGVSFDVNPMNQPMLAAVVPWIRSFLQWLCAGSLLYFVGKTMFSAIKSAGSFTQAKGSNIGVTIAGFGGQTTWFAAVAVAVITIAMLVAIPAYLFSWKLDHAAVYSFWRTNPFIGSGNASVSMGLWLLDQFVPVTAIMLYVGLGLAFYAGLSALLMAKIIVIRALPS